MSSISVNSSQLSPDIADILQNHQSKYNPIFSFETKLHTIDKDLDYKDGLTLVDFHIVRDYVENISDYIEIRLSIPLGTFLYDVYNYLENIEVTLITTKQLTKDNEPFTVKERYKAAYLLDRNIDIPNMITQSKDDLNNQMPVVIALQLLDRSSEVIRVKTTQGNFDLSINKNRSMAISDFFKSVISEEVNKVLIENKPVIDSLDIEEPDNKEKLKSLTIPSYTRIVELPYYIQNKNIGVYNGGIGIYIQRFGTDYFNYKKSLFIYSLYNVNKYNNSEYKTIFYAPMTSVNSAIGISYKYKDKILRILPFNITKINDAKETNIMSTGGGFRVANANSFMKKPVIMKPTGPVFKKDSLNTEVIFKDRADGLNYAPNKNITSNQFKLASDILKKAGVYVDIEVSNIDHDFISPNSKCKIVYEDRYGKIKEAFGVIHKAFITYSNTNQNLLLNYKLKSVNLTSHVSLQVFIN